MKSIGTFGLPGLVLLLLTIGATTAGMAQSNNEDCLAAVREAYGAFRGLSTSTVTCRARYTVRTVSTTNGKTRTNVSTLSMTANRERMHAVSETMEIYQDLTSSFVVLPDSRTIYISDPVSDSVRDQRAVNVALLQDSVLAHAYVVECSEVTDRTLGADRRVVLGVPPGMMRSLGLERVTLLMNSARNSIQRITIQYRERSVSSVEVTVHSIDCGGGTGELDRPVTSLIYSKPGTLAPRYKGYTVIDMRNRKR